MAFNTVRKLADNIAAIRIALDFNGQELLPAEIETLGRYAGFGGIKAIMFPPGAASEWSQYDISASDLKLHPQVMELHGLLQEMLGPDAYKASVDALKNSILTAYYTPAFIPAAIYGAMREAGIAPRRLYETSAGAGIFISEAVKTFPLLEHIDAVEKDFLTGKVLTARCSALKVPTDVQVRGLEETAATEKGLSDLVISNIPFGNFSVFDPAYKGSPVASKIHNYFFAKGLDKLTDGGILAYIVTDAFLNSPSNATARKFLLTSADLLSVSVLPANLMKDSSGVEVGAHLLIVQKNDSKKALTEAEALLIETKERENHYGKYHVNAYLEQHPELVFGDKVTEGRNAYGHATLTVWQNGPVEDIAASLQADLTNQLQANFDFARWQDISFEPKKIEGKQFTFLPVPEDKGVAAVGQLGLFDSLSSGNSNRANAYLGDLDRAAVDSTTARVISTIRTTARPNHDSIVLLTGKTKANSRYLYKLCSNVAEVTVPGKWMNGHLLGQELDILSTKLKYFAYDFRYEGDTSLEPAFKLLPDRPKPFTGLRPYYEKDTLVIFEEKVGLIGEPVNYEAVFRPLETQEDLQFYREYIVLRDTYLQLSGFEAEHRVQFPDLRKSLNALYEGFTGKYGDLNKNKNRNRIFNDPAFGFKIAASLELRQDDKFIRSDIFYGPVFPQKTLQQTDDPVEALAVCLNDTGKVDLVMICTATGLSEQDVIIRLDRQIFLDPETGNWETADKYLSGNVVAKLKIAEELSAGEPDNIQLAKSFAAIRRIQPENIPFELLDFNLGERWVPTEYYQRFSSALFKTETSVVYFPSADCFKAHVKKNNTTTKEEFIVVPKSAGANKIRAHTLLEHALENTSPQITYPEERGGKIVRVPDTEAIQRAHRKIELIRSRYNEWLKGLEPADKQRLEKLYNETFNCYVLREYDGGHLNFPGLDKKALGIKDLYSSQKNAAWRIIQNRGALIDHEVGLGKTLTMIVAAMEMKRLGIVHKPAIIALKANVNQVRDVFKLAYPQARLLAPGENDYTPAKRKRLFHEIKNNNWDCIILTHDQFGMIPQSPEIQREILTIELDGVVADLETLLALDGEISRAMLKGLEIRKENLGNKLKEIIYAIDNRQDTGINFQEMNIDHLFVDESHKFKNLTFTTRHTRVAGLGNLAGSQKALNMLFAVRTLQEKFQSDLCVTFLSGTPISNSLTEMYLIFKYLRPNELERQGISNFDAWAAVFARKTVDFEFTVTNEIRAKERFRHFIKVPELALFYNEITDYKTAKHINLDKPEADEKLVNIPPTEDQVEFIGKLMAFAKNGDATSDRQAAAYSGRKIWAGC